MTNPLDRTTRLVTVFGGSGFVGRHVVRALAERGWRVRVACRRPDLAFHLQPLGRVGQINAVQANLQVLSDGKPGEIYNIGGGSRIMLSDAIKVIEDVTGRTANIKYTDTQRGDAKHTFADISKAQRDLSYSPEVSIQEGITKHYGWLVENKDLYDQSS